MNISKKYPGQDIREATFPVLAKKLVGTINSDSDSTVNINPLNNEHLLKKQKIEQLINLQKQEEEIHKIRNFNNQILGRIRLISSNNIDYNNFLNNGFNELQVNFFGIQSKENQGIKSFYNFKTEEEKEKKGTLFRIFPISFLGSLKSDLLNKENPSINYEYMNYRNQLNLKESLNRLFLSSKGLNRGMLIVKSL